MFHREQTSLHNTIGRLDGHGTTVPADARAEPQPRLFAHRAHGRRGDRGHPAVDRNSELPGVFAARRHRGGHGGARRRARGRTSSSSSTTAPTSARRARRARESFTITCASDATTYTLTATGTDNLTGFVYTLDRDRHPDHGGPLGGRQLLDHSQGGYVLKPSQGPRAGPGLHTDRADDRPHGERHPAGARRAHAARRDREHPDPGQRESIKYGLDLARNDAVRLNTQVEFASTATGWEVRRVVHRRGAARRHRAGSQSRRSR